MNKGAEAGAATTVTNDPFAEFNWDNTEGQTVVTPEVIDPDDDEELEPGTVVTKTKTTKKEVVEPEEDVFEDFTEETEEKPKPAKVVKKETTTTTKVDKDTESGKNDDDDNEEDDEDVDFYTNLTTELKEKKIFTKVKLEKDEKITEEKFFDLQEEEVEARAEEMVDSLIEDLKADDAGAAYIKFIKNGGKSADFFKTFATAPTNNFPEDYDLSKATNRDKFLKFYLATEKNMDDEEIQDEIERLTEKGKADEFAEKWHAKVVTADKKAKTRLIEDQNKQIEDARKKQEDSKAKLQAKLSEVDNIGDYVFTAQEKKDLVPYFMKPSIKVGDNQFVTPFQAKLQEILKDPEQLLVLIKNVRNGFDTKEIKKSVKTEVVEKAKSSLRDSKREKTLSNKGSKPVRSLADRFDD